MKRYDFKKVARFIHLHSRLIIAGIIMCVLLIAVIGSKSGDIRTDASTRNQKYFTCIHIEYGMTLTDIAHEYMTEEYHSIYDYISEVKDINQLKDDVITSGATLVVPYYAEPIQE